MKMHRNWTWVFALPLVFAGCAGSETASGPIAEGDALPSFSVKTIDGGTLESEQLRGGPVLLSFWSTSCSTCIGEIPDLNRLASGKRVKVIGISLDSSGGDALRPFVAKHKIGYTVALGDEALFEKLQGTAIPYTVLIDGSLRIRRIYHGAVSAETLEADLEGMNHGA